MKQKVSVLLAVVTLCLSTGAVIATTFGEPDGLRHPYVGTIIFETPRGYFSCSGTLLSPTVFLTAGHCTSDGGVRNLNTWAKFTPTITFENRSDFRSLEAYLNHPSNGWVQGEAIPHPLYDDFAQFSATYDVGVVLLKSRVSSPTYGALPPVGFLNTIRSSADNNFTVVGYGLQGYIRPFFERDYVRYQGNVQLLELKSFFNLDMSAKFSNNPGVGGGSCFGDSGGPVFYSNTNMVTAVVSWGITPCIGVDYQFRVDTPIALDFLRQYVN